MTNKPLTGCWPVIQTQTRTCAGCRSWPPCLSCQPSYLEELHTLKGGLLQQGLTIRAMFPLGAGDEEFLAAAEAAAQDESLNAYARNQLGANSFLLGRILSARRL